MQGDRPISSLILAELYDSGDASFLDLILQRRGDLKPFLGLIEKWKKDSSPWARQLKFQFLLGGKSPWESRVVFKRLFKRAWIDRDSQLIGAFMVALDRSIRRARRRRYKFSAGLIESIETLRLPAVPSGDGFSAATKHYLRRRAWRYFRNLGRTDGTNYLAGIADALARYEDDDVRAGENLLDNWGLMHACFGKSPVITFNARHTNLAVEGRLADMQAAPMFERHWASADGLPVLIEVLLHAASRPIQVWAIQLLQRLHADALPKINAETLLKLLDHPNPDVAAFGAGLLADAQTAASFPMPMWMALLDTRNPTVVASICEAFRKHVSFDRVTIAQAVELTIRKATPVASLGLEILEGKPIRSVEDFRELTELSRASSSATGAKIAAFALSGLNVTQRYQLDEIIAFFDNRIRSVRDGSFDALADQSPADTDPAFWARLFESPYDDVRARLVDRLKRRAPVPGASSRSLAALWQSVLLNIHRGGRSKLSALKQISDRIVLEPDSAKVLLPILAIAIRSVRPPEARHGLAAIVAAVEHVPSLAIDVKRHLPELEIDLVGVAI